MENKKKFDLLDYPILLMFTIMAVFMIIVKVFIFDSLSLDSVIKKPTSYYRGENLVISIPVINKNLFGKSVKIDNIYLNGCPERITAEYSNSVKGHSYKFAEIVVNGEEYTKTKNNCRDNGSVVYDITIGDEKGTEGTYCLLP